MPKTVKQHYIPRFYMKNFYIGETNKFDVLDKTNKYAPISRNKDENFKNLFYKENLYETCNINVNYIETNVLAQDNEDKTKKIIKEIILKIYNNIQLTFDDKLFLRRLYLQMSVRNPYGVKAVQNKYNDIQSRELFFRYAFSSDSISKEKQMIADVLEGCFDVVCFTTNQSSFILSDSFSLKMLANSIKNTYSARTNMSNYVVIFPLTKDILVCIVNHESESISFADTYIELAPKEVSCINKMMMCNSTRFCIGDLNRYASHLKRDLDSFDNLSEDYIDILIKHKILNKRRKNGNTIKI